MGGVKSVASSATIFFTYRLICANAKSTLSGRFVPALVVGGPILTSDNVVSVMHTRYGPTIP